MLQHVRREGDVPRGGQRRDERQRQADPAEREPSEAPAQRGQTARRGAPRQMEASAHGQRPADGKRQHHPWLEGPGQGRGGGCRMRQALARHQQDRRQGG
jgi:hypothetical protein